MKCAKCSSEMEEGMIPTYRIGATSPSFWIEKVSFLKGMENKHDIVVHRCAKCGFLESYAK